MNRPCPDAERAERGEPIRLCIVCHPTYGGSGVVASELGMRLAERGHEVHFVSYQLPFRVDDAHPNVHFHEVEVSSYPLFRYPPYALALATELVSVVRSAGARLIHVHYAIPHSISAYLTRQMCVGCDIKTITTLHGTDITLVGSDASFADVTRFGIEQSDAVTAVSQSLKKDTREHFGISCDIEVIPNFVDLDRFSPDRFDRGLRRRFARDDEKLLVHVSNFRPVKRIADVVRIFDRVQRATPARLLLIGSGPERQAAEDEIARRDLANSVEFVGSVAGVAEHLAVADLLLLPSDSESFGLAALEAMASGVPVVATRSGGLPEVIEDGVTGILGAVGDVDDMGARASRLLLDPDEHAAMRERARATAQDRFDVDRIVDQYETLYRKTLNSRRE